MNFLLGKPISLFFENILRQIFNNLNINQGIVKSLS
jgi:hypothetical protein